MGRKDPNKPQEKGIYKEKGVFLLQGLVLVPFRVKKVP